MNVCSMTVIQNYYIRHVVIVMSPTSVTCLDSVPFTNPLPWPYGTIKCPLEVISTAGHPSSFCLLFYNILWIWPYYCSHAVLLLEGKHVISDAVKMFIILNFCAKKLVLVRTGLKSPIKACWPNTWDLDSIQRSLCHCEAPSKLS